MATIGEALALAMQYHQSGNLVQAEQVYRQVLEADPTEANCLHLLGVLAHQAGQHEAAVAWIRQALAVVPQAPMFHANLALVYVALGRLDEAVDCYEQAVRYRPTSPADRINLGNVLKQMGRLAEAEGCYREALRLQPGNADALTNLGAAQAEQGRAEEALTSYRLALRKRLDLPEAHNNLGNILKQMGRFAEAENSYREALRLRPDLPETHHNLGLALAADGKHDEALACHAQALQLRPDYAEALTGLATAYKDQGRLDEAIAAHRQAIVAKPEVQYLYSNLLFALHYHAAYDPETTFAEHLRWAGQFGTSPAQHRPLYPINRDPGRRLRVGYVSADFCEHVMGHYSGAVIAGHDRSQVEVYCYANVPYADAVTQRIRASADHWRSILGLSDTQAADVVLEDQIDVLVDLGGHTGGNRLGVFAKKPAPIQVTHFGYCDTTGLAAIDYRLTDAYCDPPGRTERFHSEELVRLPEVQWCYVPSPCPEVGPLPALKGGQVTFGSFSNLAKVTQPMIGLWSQILRDIPGSRMVVVTGAGRETDERVRAAFVQQGVAQERVTLVGRQLIDAYFRLYHGVDICLDVYPFSGCFTTADALWMGVPVVSLAGPTFATRQGVAILAQVGLEDLVAETPEAYVETAIRLAGDLPRLEKLRYGLRERLKSSPLADVPRFTRHLEAAYRGMWERFCRGDSGDLRAIGETQCNSV